MGQQEQVMSAFIQWLPQNITKFGKQLPQEIVEPIAAAQSPDDVVGILNELSQSEEGSQVVSTLFETFQQSANMFKEGGKIEYLSKRFGYKKF